MKNINSNWEYFLQTILRINIYSPSIIFKDSNAIQEFAGLYLIHNTNGWEIYNENGSTFADGLFPHLAILNHSCSPNCTLIYTN